MVGSYLGQLQTAEGDPDIYGTFIKLSRLEESNAIFLHSHTCGEKANDLQFTEVMVGGVHIQHGLQKEMFPPMLTKQLSYSRPEASCFRIWP